jgi:ferredoxin-NADP reductase
MHAGALLPTQPLRSSARRLLPTGLAQALAAPHDIDRYLAPFRPAGWLGDSQAELVAVRRRSPRGVTIKLRPHERWRGFSAGQFIRLTVEIAGVRETRCYSPACSERTGGEIELTVTAHPGGRVSRYLNERARPGMVFGLSEADGEFVLARERPARLLLISSGSGIAPVMALLRTLCAEGYAGTVTFLHYARTRGDVIYRSELAAIAARHRNVSVAFAYTREAPTGGSGDAGRNDDAGRNGDASQRRVSPGSGQLARHAPPSSGQLAGHISRGHLRRIAPDHRRAHTYVCGSPGLLEWVRAAWAEDGIEERLHVESFLAPTPTPAGGEDGTGGSVGFMRSGARARGDGRSLLEQAERAGLRPPFGCRMGICRICTCRKTAGSVRNVLSGEISSAREEDIQLCVSVPVGDVELAL